MNLRIPRPVWLIVLLAGCRSQAHQVSLKPDAGGPLHGDAVSGGRSTDASTALASRDGRGDVARAPRSNAAGGGAGRDGGPTTPGASFNAVAEHLAQGRIEIGRGNLEQAQLHYRRVLQDEPDNVEAHHRLAVIADKHKSFPEAERHYRAALRARPDDPDLLSDLGYSYLLQGNYPESERTLNQALRIDPRHVRATNNLGMLYGTQRNYPKAMAMFRRAGSEDEAREKMARLFPNAVLPETLTAGAESPAPSSRGLPSQAPLADAGERGPANDTMERIKQEMDRARREAESKRQLARRGAVADPRFLAGAEPRAPVDADPRFGPGADPRVASGVDSRGQNASFEPRLRERPGQRYPEQPAPPHHAAYGGERMADPSLWPPAPAQRSRPLHPSQINQAFEQIDRQAEVERRGANGLWPPVGAIRPAGQTRIVNPETPQLGVDPHNDPRQPGMPEGAGGEPLSPSDGTARSLPSGVRTLWDPDVLPPTGVERADYNRMQLDDPRDRRSVDPRQVDPRFVDPRQVDPRQYDPRQVDPRQYDPRQVDPRQVDPRQVDPRQYDPRQYDPRQVDPRLNVQPPVRGSVEPAPYGAALPPADAQRLATQMGMEAGPGTIFPVVGREGGTSSGMSDAASSAARLSPGALSHGAVHGAPPREIRPGQPGYDTPREVVQVSLDHDPLATAPEFGGYTRTQPSRQEWGSRGEMPSDSNAGLDAGRHPTSQGVDPYQEDLRRHDERFNATLRNMDRERVMPAGMEQLAPPSGQYYPPGDPSLRVYEEMRGAVRPGHTASFPLSDRRLPDRGPAANGSLSASPEARDVRFRSTFGRSPEAGSPSR